MNKFLLTDNELQKFGNIKTLSDKAEALLNHQKLNWELVKNNFGDLVNVKIKTFQFDHLQIKIQFNPSRIKSTSAKVDAKSIAERKCFLCFDNLPNEQRGIKYNNDYILLCNPYPIFDQHLTIPNVNHIPQSIQENFLDLLSLSFYLRDNFFVFYNGPKCGASAPDHLHFQAGKKNVVPLENDYSALIKNFGELIVNKSEIKLIFVNHPFRPFLSIESVDKVKIHNLFGKMLNSLIIFTNSKEEPLLNVISYFEEEKWKVIIFPRETHRPKQYYAEDNSKLLISPASVDMAGLIIVPNENDFLKISKNDVEDIYKQVSLNGKKIIEVLKSINF
jgi:ATP adenylyltransferase/5',5'''-P-1,P-4-tetraphosphate phosphorylase II